MMIRIFRHFVPVQILALVVVDVALLFGSMYAGIALRFFGGDRSDIADILPIYPKAMVFALVILGAMTALGLYIRDVVRGGWGYYGRLVLAFAAGVVVMTLIFYAVPALFLGRGAFGLAVLFALLGQVAARGVFLRVVGNEALKRRILVLGTGSRAAQVEEILRRDDLDHKFHFVGYVAIGGRAGEVDASKILPPEPLISLAVKYDVEEIIVGVRNRRGGALPMDQLLECKLEGINVIDLPSFFEREVGHVQLDSLNPSWMVFSDGFCRTSFRNSVKRAFDLVMSVALLIPALPVMALFAVLIHLETGAPILYRQTRVGECGQPFEVLKFRSMRVDAEGDGKPQWAKAGDTRVTRVGRFIRKTRIDELPQIFNVLRGDMSFVGPRPERPFFVDELMQQIPYYANRHSVKPGITGWAQVNYPYGASVEDSRRKLQYDLYYAKNHSLFLDLLIMLQTAQVVLFGRGAR
jgi:sugar transferase (PEP-CTERM system associated)